MIIIITKSQESDTFSIQPIDDRGDLLFLVVGVLCFAEEHSEYSLTETNTENQ